MRSVDKWSVSAERSSSAKRGVYATSAWYDLLPGKCKSAVQIAVEKRNYALL